MKRSLLAKDMTKTVEFIIEYTDKGAKAEVKPVPFTITPETLQNNKEVSTLCKGIEEIISFDFDFKQM